jgi:hypothetical protein
MDEEEAGRVWWQAPSPGDHKGRPYNATALQAGACMDWGAVNRPSVKWSGRGLLAIHAHLY